MRYRRFFLPGFLFTLTASFGLALAPVACSNDDPADPAVDASVDGTAPDAGRDSGGGDGAPSVNCSAVKGPACDLVLQNCETGKECSTVRADAGGFTTACVDAGTGNRPAGASCCPDQANHCAAGLVCIGGQACSGDAAPTGRCTPRCCVGDDRICGESIPEGFQGICDTQIQVSDGKGVNVPVYHVCSYKTGCKPFRIEPCAANETCLLQADRASFRCVPVIAPPGKPAGQSCVNANDCADGLHCLGQDGGGGVCRTLCYRPGGDPPFDASAVRNEPGYGGCPGGAACTGTISGFPAYLGYCP